MSISHIPLIANMVQMRLKIEFWVVTDQEKRPEQQIELKPILLYMYVYVTAKISYRHLTLG